MESRLLLGSRGSKDVSFASLMRAGSEEEKTTQTQQAPLEKSIIKCSGKA